MKFSRRINLFDLIKHTDLIENVIEVSYSGFDQHGYQWNKIIKTSEFVSIWMLRKRCLFKKTSHMYLHGSEHRRNLL